MVTVTESEIPASIIEEINKIEVPLTLEKAHEISDQLERILAILLLFVAHQINELSNSVGTDKKCLVYHEGVEIRVTPEQIEQSGVKELCEWTEEQLRKKENRRRRNRRNKNNTSGEIRSQTQPTTTQRFKKLTKPDFELVILDSNFNLLNTLFLEVTTGSTYIPHKQGQLGVAIAAGLEDHYLQCTMHEVAIVADLLINYFPQLREWFLENDLLVLLLDFEKYKLAKFL